MRLNKGFLGAALLATALLAAPVARADTILHHSVTATITTMPDNAQKATLAAGCFWGVEHLFRKHFGNGKGLLDAKVGYCGGTTQSPTYRIVCSGTTGRKCIT